MNLVILRHIVFIALVVFSCEVQGRRKKKQKSYRVVRPVHKNAMTPKEVLGSLTEVGLKPHDINRPAAKLLLDLYEQLQRNHGATDVDNTGELFDADTVRSFTTKVAVYEGKGKARFTFNLSSISDHELTQHAELHVRARHNDAGRRHRFRVTILNEDGRQEQKMTIKVAAQSQTYDGYLVFNITEIIKQLVDKTNGDLEKVLEISIQHKDNKKRHNRNKRDVEEEMSRDDGILVVYSQDKHFFNKFNSQIHNAMKKVNTDQLVNDRLPGQETVNTREKRDTKKQKKHCERKDFTVDFEALGWNKWIVYPKTYNAYMCSGKCPSPVDWSFNPTNHAVLQSLMRLKYKKVARPCCAPIKLAPLSMLYHEYGEIVVRHHKDMVATKCGCR